MKRTLALGVLVLGVVALIVCQALVDAAPAEQSAQFRLTFPSPSGASAVTLTAAGDLDEGAVVLRVEGLSGHSGVVAIPGANPMDDIVQWVDETRYILSGTLVVNVPQGTADPIPLSFMYTYLASALSPDREELAVLVRNYERETVQAWVIALSDMSPRLIFEEPLLPPYTELRRSAAWGANGALYFQVVAGGTSNIYSYDRAHSPALFLADAASPNPSPDSCYLAFVKTDPEGRGIGWAFYDLASNSVIEETQEVGVLTWSQQRGVCTVHRGGTLSILDVAMRTPTRTMDLPGLIAVVTGNQQAFRVVVLTATENRLVSTQVVEVPAD